MPSICWGYYLFWLTNPVKGERYNMSAVENVSVPTATGDRGYLAAIEADGHLVGDLWLWCGGRFSYCATEVKPCKEWKKVERKMSASKKHKNIPSSFLKHIVFVILLSAFRLLVVCIEKDKSLKEAAPVVIWPSSNIQRTCSTKRTWLNETFLLGHHAIWYSLHLTPYGCVEWKKGC